MIGNFVTIASLSLIVVAKISHIELVPNWLSILSVEHVDGTVLGSHISTVQRTMTGEFRGTEIRHILGSVRHTGLTIEWVSLEPLEGLDMVAAITASLIYFRVVWERFVKGAGYKHLGRDSHLQREFVMLDVEAVGHHGSGSHGPTGATVLRQVLVLHGRKVVLEFAGAFKIVPSPVQTGGKCIYLSLRNRGDIRRVRSFDDTSMTRRSFCLRECSGKCKKNK